MREWRRAEWRHARLATWALAGVHLVALMLATRLTPLPQLPAPGMAMMGLVYLVGGLLLGAWQTRLRRAPQAWLGLLHRPLPAHHIGLQMAALAAWQLLVVVALPAGLALGAMLWMGQGPQWHHLGLVAVAWGVSMAGWLTASAALLAPWPRSLALWLAPMLLLKWPLPVPGLLLLVGLGCAWLLAVFLLRVQPDWSKAPRGAARLLPEWALQALVWAWLLPLGLQLGAQAVMGLMGQHPSVQAASTLHLEHWLALKPAEQLAQAMVHAKAGDSTAWTAQDLATARTQRVIHPGAPLPQRWMPGQTAQTDWRDAERGWQMQFDHAARRYRVRDARGRSLGWLGRGCLHAERDAVAAFDEQLPLASPMGLLDGAQLWQWQAQRPCLQALLRLPAQEGHLLDVLRDGDGLITLSARGVQRWTPGRGTSASAAWQQQWAWAWPGAAQEAAAAVQNLVIATHAQGDAWLLSVLQGRHLPPSEPSVAVWQVNPQGQVQAVARIGLQRDYPDWFVWADALLTPAWAALGEWAAFAWAGWTDAATPRPMPTPRPAQLDDWASASAVLALSAAAGLGYHRARRWRVVWPAAAAAALMGWAALLLLLVYPARKSWQ